MKPSNRKTNIRTEADRAAGAMTDARVFELLPLVSRTFALSIGRLSGRLAADIAFAYLVCRLLDTVEDDSTLPAAERSRMLQRLALTVGRDLGRERTLRRIAALLPRITAKPAERELLAEAPALFARFDLMPPEVAAPIRRSAAEMAAGMARSVTDGISDRIVTRADLATYCHYVAGTVGALLTDIFVAHGRARAERSRQKLHADAPAFGRGLQLVNIIKDSGRDYADGRCFLPREMFDAAGLSREEFFAAPGRDRERRRIIGELVAQASRDLDAAVRYTKTLPRRMWRARLFCLLPIVLARSTLALIARAPERVADSRNRVRISRLKVRLLVLVSFPAAFSNSLLSLVGRDHSAKRQAASSK